MLGTPSWLYVETSALMAGLLESDSEAIARIRARGKRTISALTLAEARRAILRAKFSGRISAQQQQALMRALATFSRRCHVVQITDAILKLASRPFPVEPIRTLDAIHMATLQELDIPTSDLIVLTRDDRIRANAIALGYPVA